MNKKQRDEKLYSFIPLEDFKALAGIDDRDDRIAEFCLRTSIIAIQKYCMRCFIKYLHYELLELNEENFYELKQYPVRKIVSCRLNNYDSKDKLDVNEYFYQPDKNNLEDVQHILMLKKELTRIPKIKYLCITYKTGYDLDDIPADLKAACLELALWNFNRYKNKQIGMAGSITKGVAFLTHTMPENVKALLEPYRRKTI